MKRLFCSVLICFALIGCSQADSPSAIVLKGEAGMYDAGMWAVAFSPDGKKIASASHDGTARIWTLE